ncbi:carboxylesterase family protein [uncultured Microbacterium sp.]|uniref:carboxylesterase/lipase family protein n=1 Tax=uncultured Microbacterium sp. TaxID=191216 RepID=UPI0028D050DF|nr:carboxylesterase family protein [uncultured Microbacterium sp.]
MIVDTPLGPVAGTRRETPHGSVSTFLGIPYAEAPGPSGRFRPAPPARRQRAVRDATAPGPIVPQDPDIFRAMLGMPADPWSEAGCLTANVWAPEGARDLPVMVWVHGGGYVGGSNSSPRTDGARLASFGRVVVVALSYRLGVFGFLPAFAELGEGFEDAANLGILDLVVGLEWVREHVSAFGGDPAAVTVFGESAGAAAVATLLGMPRARGLFRRAIMQSGTAERARTQDQAAEMSARFLHASGLTAHTARHLLDWPADRVLDAQRSFTDVIARDTVGVPLPFQPVIDGRSIPMLPLDAVRNGEGGGVDLLVGTNLNEGSFFTTMGDEADRTDERFGEALETLARQNVPALPDAPVSYRAELADEIGREPTSAEAVEAFLSDVQYRQPSNRLLEARASASARTYSYLFTWPSPVVPGLGACHTLDIPFVFRLLDHPEHTPLVGEHPPGELSEEMSAAWSAFAATGEPGIRWPAYGSERRATMIVDADLEVAADPRAGLRRWWLDART